MKDLLSGVSFIWKSPAGAMSGAALFATVFVASPAFAQTAPAPATGQEAASPDAAAVKMERFEVTGSSIKRIDAETALPVLTVNVDDILRMGVSNSEQLLKTTSVTSTLGATQVANTGAGGGQGGAGSVSLVSLRGLGSARTLVLINGRRSAPAGGAAVDIGTIPLAAIDRVEVLMDGSSAVYGSDAVAGVINFIMKRDYSGAELSTTFGAPTRTGGGTEEKASAFAGFSDGDRFSATLGASYAYTQPIFGNTRSFARNLDVANQLDKTSTTSFPANVRLNNGSLVSPVYPNCGPYSETSALNPGLCRYDNAPYISLQPKIKLYNLSGSARYKFSKEVELYVEPSFSRNDTLNTTQHVLINGAVLPAGAPYIATLTNLINTQYAQFATQLKPLIGSAYALLPASSPYYPTAWVNANLGPNLLAGQPLVLLFRSVPTGARQTRDVDDSVRVVGGMRGVAAGWDYDAGLLYSQWKNKDSLAQGWALFDKYLSLVDSGVINPFGPTTDANALSQAMASNYNGLFTTTTTAVSSADAKASRELFKLPAGMLSVALGGELRREKLDINPSDANRNFQVSGFGAAGVPTTASRNVQSAYAEANVPILKDVKGFKNLEADAAIRFDSYERVGDTTNPKGSLRWQPFTGLLLRGSAGSGFRAPTLINLFQPQARGITTNGSRDLVRCPIGTTGIIDCSTQFVTLAGGNPNLQPEKSLSTTAGLTFEPTKNYSIDIDYWRISVSDVISSALSTATILGDPVRYASFIHRGAPDGNASGVGPILGIDQGLVNLGKSNVDGLDLDLAGRIPVTQKDRLTLRLQGTYLMRFDQQATNGTFTNSINNPASSGIGIGVALRWRHIASATWGHGPWTASASQNFQTGYHDLRTSLQSAAAVPIPRRVAPYETYDTQLSYTGIKSLRLTLGIKNVFDRDPPYTNYGAGFVGGYDLSYTDVRGRFVYLTATYDLKAWR